MKKSDNKKNSRKTLSVCMIVRDEEAVLGRCLQNVSEFADEIIVVDTGSVDRTKEIASRYTGFVYNYEWRDDFADARNFSYSFATCDYIMWLDADDDMEPEDISLLKELMENMPGETDVVFLTYTGDKDDNDLTSDCYLVRDKVIRRDLRPLWLYPIHEAIRISPEWNLLYRPDIRIFHRKVTVNEEKRNIRIFEKKLSEGFKMNCFNRSYYCRELAFAGRYEEAAGEFDALWDNGKKINISYALFFYIDSMNHLKRFEELRIRLEDYTERFGPSDIVFCALGDISRRSGQYQDAINWYEKALGVIVDPCDMELHFPCYHDFLPYLGMTKAFLKMNDKDSAEKMILKAQQIHPGYPELKIIKLWIDNKETRQ